MVQAAIVPQALLMTAASAPVLFVTLIAVGRWLHRNQGVQLGLAYHLFCAGLAIYIPLQFFQPDFPNRRPVMQALGAACILVGTFPLTALVRRYYWELWFEKRHRTRAPKFVSEVSALLLFIAAVFVTLSGVYGFNNVPGIVAGSTVVAAIIGFALQDLLGNIIAGISLEVGKPFRTGDWLIVEGQHAEVIEVNWRSTRLRTNDDIYLDIPNKSIVGATITNLTYPTRQHALRITVRFDYTTPPNFVKDCLTHATSQAPGVLATPPPKVFLQDFGDSAVLYEIKFWLENEQMLNPTLDAIRTNIWYEAQRNNLRMPYPIRTLQVERPRARHQDALASARSSIRKQPFFQLLDTAQTDRLLMHAKLLRFGRGEKVIEQGQSGESMFILLQGEADVYVSANESDTHVATLKSGDYFGEMSLLTGEPRTATVCARTDCELWEIEKSVIAELLQENEALVGKLSDLLAQRRLEMEGVLAAAIDRGELSAKQREYTASFLRKLYSFFEL